MPTRLKEHQLQQTFTSPSQRLLIHVIAVTLPANPNELLAETEEIRHQIGYQEQLKLDQFCCILAQTCTHVQY